MESDITRGFPRCHGWGKVSSVRKGKRATDVQSKPAPPPQKEGAHDEQINVGLPSFQSEGFGSREDMRAHCAPGTDERGTSSPLVRIGGLSLRSERESLHGNGGEMRLEVDPWRLRWEELEEGPLWQENGLASGLDLRKKMDAGQGALEVTGVRDGKEELKRGEGEGLQGRGGKEFFAEATSR
ncbi:hypothetical protein G5714_000016 [Onychostoma macrolepis]|uniref:Uncharacterized protein n=1 Tax=Onychostoma macrolepis TaxID=369639 RepID=A0A7J6DG35_9TELE|nr:hypothetical protein G5714_000016 [Onychostoma macrolepis]